MEMTDNSVACQGIVVLGEESIVLKVQVNRCTHFFSIWDMTIFKHIVLFIYPEMQDVSRQSSVLFVGPIAHSVKGNYI
jgi:hypothetical protein